MTYHQIRLIKRLLALVLVGFGSLVAYHLYRGLDKRQKRLDGPLPVADESADPLARQIELTRLDSEGKRQFVLRAAESVGGGDASQSFRDVEILFSAGKEQIPLVITADRCRYDARTSAAHLEGNVVVQDEESLRIETSVLDYRRQPERVWTHKPVHFTRKGLEGNSGSLYYEVGAAKFFLEGAVAMRLRRGRGLPVDITSHKAVLRRHAGTVQFIDDVVARQGSRRLRCNDLQLFLTADEEGIDHIEAYEKVELLMRTRSGGSAPERTEGASDASSRGIDLRDEPGTKRLLTEKLEVQLRPDGETLERARAVGGGRLLLESSSAGGRTVMRQLEGHLLAFDFDEQGRLYELRGRGGVAMTLAGQGQREDEQRRVTARQLEARFDPVTGDLLQARCVKSVELTQAGLRATAGRGLYETSAETLTLTDSPRLWNERAQVEAERIQIDVVTGNLEAWGSVHATLAEPEERASGLFPGSGEGPVHFVADHLSHRPAEDVAVYTGSARGFQGDNRVEADRIELRQQRGELEAQGSVRTVLLQKPEGRQQAEPSVTRAQRLSYRSADNVLRYRRGVQMTTGEQITMGGRRVDVILSEQTGEVVEVRAEGGVEIVSTEGRARGDLAKYLPKTEEVHVKGERAQLQSADKLTEGKELTFFLSDDKIFVDGLEKSRTKTTYASKPRPR